MDLDGILCTKCGTGRYKIKRSWLVECDKCGHELQRFINADDLKALIYMEDEKK